MEITVFYKMTAMELCVTIEPLCRPTKSSISTKYSCSAPSNIFRWRF